MVAILIALFYGSPDIRNAVIYRLFDGNEMVQQEIIEDIKKNNQPRKKHDRLDKY